MLLRSLPELITAEAEEKVSIRFGRVEHSFLQTLKEDWGHFNPTPGENYLFWQKVGSFLV